MRKLVTGSLCFIPYLCFGQQEVGPDGYVLYLFFAFVLAIPLLFVLFKLAAGQEWSWIARKKNEQVNVWMVYRAKGQVSLLIENKGDKKQIFNAPILVFQKGFKTRKFRLKSINNTVVYPVIVESAQKRELQFNLNVFHKHDPDLNGYRRIWICIDTDSGKTYTTAHLKRPQNDN